MRVVNYEAAEGMFLVPMTLAFATGDLDLNDVVNGTYLPANVTVYGIHYAPTDMDTDGTPAIVQKITIGSTDVATGLTGAQSGAASYVAIAPRVLTEKELVKVTTTTAPDVAAAGSVRLAFVCQK